MLCTVDKKFWFRRGTKKLQETFSSHWDRSHRSRFNISWTTKISQRWNNCKQHNIFILHFLRLTKHLVLSSLHLRTKSAFRITRTSPTSKDTGERLWSWFYLLKDALVMVLLKDSLMIHNCHRWSFRDEQSKDEALGVTINSVILLVLLRWDHVFNF